MLDYQPKQSSSRGKLTAPPELSKKWPDYAVVFGCESRTDNYVLEEEGAFFDDDLPSAEREVLEAYFRSKVFECFENRSLQMVLLIRL